MMMIDPEILVSGKAYHEIRAKLTACDSDSSFAYHKMSKHDSGKAKGLGT